MSRAIVCPEHGKIKPTHPEDAARGLFVRYVRGKLKQHVYCDTCGTRLDMGDDAVAISQPSTMGRWEVEYFQDFVPLYEPVKE